MQGCSPGAGTLGDGVEGQKVALGVGAAGGSSPMNASDGPARFPLNASPLVWAERQKLLASDGAENAQFGSQVALDGDTALVIAGTVGGGIGYVFVRSAAGWVQQAKLVVQGAAAGERFGTSVSLSGDTALVGAVYNSGGGFFSGAAYVFVRSATSWQQQSRLVAPVAALDDYFGISVSLSGDTALVGASGEHSFLNWDETPGAAYVFVRSATSWTMQDKFASGKGVLGDKFGDRVSLSGDTALVGARYDEDEGVVSGAAYVFVRSATSWAQQGDALAGDHATFGSRVSLDGDTALAAGNDASAVPGVYAFARSATGWSRNGRLMAAGVAGFGASVSVDGNAALVGAIDPDILRSDKGSAYVFVRSATGWEQGDTLLASDGAAWDNFGSSVSLSGKLALVGALSDDDLGDGSGSAYLFALRLVEGQPCSSADACVSQFCVDGYCCEGACDGSCETCDIAGLEGTCSVTARGSEPAPSCNGYLCSGEVVGCPSGCAGDADCASGYHCPEGIACVPKAIDGKRCASADVCLSGHCVDGICCEQACDGGCGSCVIAGLQGSCTPLGAGQPGTPSCAPYLCAEGDASCPNGCSAHGDCAPGNHCAGGVCYPNAQQGAACSEAEACASGYCTDGVCCLVDACGAYRCGPGGTCEAVCSSSAQCADGHECNSASQCVPRVEQATGAATESGGCHISSAAAGGSRSSRWPGAAAWLACLVLIRRRRVN